MPPAAADGKGEPALRSIGVGDAARDCIAAEPLDSVCFSAPASCTVCLFCGPVQHFARLAVCLTPLPLPAFPRPCPTQLVPALANDPVGQDLLSRLLSFDPRKRITASQAMAHPWFAGVEVPDAAATAAAAARPAHAPAHASCAVAAAAAAATAAAAIGRA